MRLEQSQKLIQRLALTQTMRQSLDCLQLSAPELTEYVQEIALSNPLLDVQVPAYYETELPTEMIPSKLPSPPTTAAINDLLVMFAASAG